MEANVRIIKLCDVIDTYYNKLFRKQFCFD